MGLMKQFVKFFVPVAAAAIALFSCAKETKAPVPEGIEISVSAAVDEIDAPATASKTYMGASNTILWGKAEQMKIAITGESTVFANSASTDAYNGQKQATFSFTLTPPAGSSFLHQGIYPASVALTPTSSNNNPAEYKVELPAIQAATAASYDPAAYILVAYPQSFDEVKSEWKAYFRRATALNKITLTGLSEDIVSVEFTAPEGAVLAGRRHIDLTTGESGDIYFGGTNVLKVNYATALTGASKAVWFTSWEATIPEGQTLKVVAKSATKSYTRTITARAGGIKFLEGKLNLLEVDMSSAQEEDLVDYSGAYLIASIKDNKWHLMDPANTGSIYPSLATDLAADPANNEYSLFAGVENIDDYVFTIAAYDGAYSIKSESTGKYVAYHGSSNDAYAADELGDDTKIDISYDAATKVAELASVNVSGRHLVFNSSQPRFAFYTSAQAGVYLIPAVADPRTPVTLSFDESYIEVASTVAGGFSGQIVTSDPAVTGIEYSWDGEDAFGTLDEATGEVSLHGIAGSATITATFAGDSQYRPATASYTLSVIDPNKIYYVKVTAALSDWSGEYLIVNETHNVAWNAALSDLDATPNTFEVTIVNGKIERTDGTEGKQFEIAPMEGGYSILASNGKYIGRTAASNGVSVSNNPLLNTISWTDNHPVITGGESGKTISYNAASGQEKFRYLGTSDISLFKKNDPRPVCATPTFSVAEGAVEAGTVVTISTATDGADIYYSTNGSNPTADSGIKGTSVTIEANTTLKAIAVKAGYKNSPVASAVYTVAGSGNDGTLQHPYTATEVLGIASTENDVYVAGTIKSITEVSTGYGNATYTITDNSSDALVFRGRFVANTAFTAADQIKVGDKVIICGKIGQHNNVSQLAQGNYIYSLNGITKVLAQTTVSAVPDNDNLTVSVSWTAVDGATAYNVSCGSKSQNGITGTAHVFTMDDYGNYTVTVEAVASDAIASVATTDVALSDPSSSHTAVADGTILLQEPFTGFLADAVPTANSTSAVVYGDASLTYSCVNGGSATRMYNEALAGGESPEILVGKATGKLTISSIPTGWAETITLTYKSNKATLQLSSSTAGVTIGSVTSIGNKFLAIITTNGNVESFNLTFSNTDSANARLDDINVIAGEFILLATPTISASKDDANKKITVSWEAVSGATNYDVTCGDLLQRNLTGTSTTFTVSDYGEYEVSVTAKAANGIPATASTKITLIDPTVVVEKKTYTYTITTSDFTATGYGKAMKDITATATDGSGATVTVSHATNNAGLQSGKIQFKKNVGMLYNTTDLGTVISVTLTGASGGTGTVYKGASQNPTTSGSGGFFTVKETANGTLTCTSITVTFEK